MTDTPLTIASSELSADVALLGAELVRLDDAVGNPLLWSGDPNVWAGRAPLLFPIVGTLADDTFLHRGHSWRLPRHGFARRSTFTLIERGTAHVALRLEASAETLAVWPFAFRLDVTHAIDGATLSTTAEVTNLSDEPMPTAFGFHHGFRRPLPGAGARGDHRIRFEAPEPGPIHRLAPNGLLDPTPRPTPVVGDTLALDDALFADDVVMMLAPASRRLVYGTEHVHLAIAHPDMPHLGLWTKPGAGFLCIEPWQGHADPVGAPGEITAKPGSLLLAPGESRRFSIAVTLEFRTDEPSVSQLRNERSRSMRKA
ncbi:MAG: aldose 1-epimerase family protein [Siculibacillus sp.]